MAEDDPLSTVPYMESEKVETNFAVKKDMQRIPRELVQAAFRSLPTLIFIFSIFFIIFKL